MGKYEPNYKPLLIMLVLVPLLLFGIFTWSTVNMFEARKEVSDIFQAYVVRAEEEQGLTETAKIGLEYAIKQLGYDTVEITVPLTKESEAYPILVSAYKYNLRGGIADTLVLQETIYLTSTE